MAKIFGNSPPKQLNNDSEILEQGAKVIGRQIFRIIKDIFVLFGSQMVAAGVGISCYVYYYNVESVVTKTLPDATLYAAGALSAIMVINLAVSYFAILI